MLRRRGQHAAVRTLCQHGAADCAILGGAGSCRDPPGDGRSHSPSRVSAKASRGSAEKTICHGCWGMRAATALQACWKAVTRLLLLRARVSRAAASQVLQVERHLRTKWLLKGCVAYFLKPSSACHRQLRASRPCFQTPAVTAQHRRDGRNIKLSGGQLQQPGASPVCWKHG